MTTTQVQPMPQAELVLRAAIAFLENVDKLYANERETLLNAINMHATTFQVTESLGEFSITYPTTQTNGGSSS